MQIIQDYKSWKEAKKNTKLTKSKLATHFNAMLGHVSLEHYDSNMLSEAVCMKHAPNPEITPTEFKKYMETFAKDCHAYPCFYVVNNPFDFIGINNINREKQTKRCINNREDGMVYEAFCHDCPCFKDLVEYQSLKAQLQTAQDEQKTAKQKLLSNFMFWKTK